MTRFLRHLGAGGAMLLALGLFLPAAAQAQTDEIQVYDAAIAAQGKFNLMVHTNFTPDGVRTPAFQGALIANHSFNGVAEWAYGYKPWLELGLYLPLFSVTPARGATINGGKLRALFVSPHADERTFFYGMNFEFSYNAAHWDARHYTSEIRPIIGWHLHPWDFIFNPILDNSWRGGFKSLDFAPAARIAYNFSPTWALAAEEYADFGPLRQLYSSHDQAQELWATVDHETKLIDIETGIGYGLTPSSDRITLKLMLSRDLN